MWYNDIDRRKTLAGELIMEERAPDSAAGKMRTIALDKLEFGTEETLNAEYTKTKKERRAL